jgi:hypothetical protein
VGTRWIGLLASVVVALTLCPTSAAPQSGSGSSSDPWQPFVGVGAGLGAFPGVFDPQCRSGLHGATAAASADVRGGAAKGPWRFEARASKHGEMEFEDCLYIGPWQPDGTHTFRTSGIERGGITVSDIRVAYAVSQRLAYWNVSSGLGWVWGAGVPSVLIGTGIGLGRSFRVGLDGEIVHYRIPWDIVTAEWRDGQVVREFSREVEPDWRRGGSVRLHVEYTLPVLRP